MLVLTRRIGETVIIGKDISVTVIKYGGGQVKLGFDAPKDIKILREEIIKKGEDENEKND